MPGVEVIGHGAATAGRAFANLSEISNENLFGKMLRGPLRLIPRTAVVRILQGPLRGKKWIVGSSNHRFWLGCAVAIEKPRPEILPATHGACVHQECLRLLEKRKYVVQSIDRRPVESTDEILAWPREAKA